MRRNISTYFNVFLAAFVLFGFFYFFLTEVFLKSKIKEEIKSIKVLVLKNKKEELKKDIKNIKDIYEFVKKTVYSSNKEELLKFVNIPIKWNISKLIVQKEYIYGLLNKKLDYSIENNYVFANINDKKFLVGFKNKGKKVYIFGISKKFLDDIIIYNFLKYLDKYNKNRISYIAMGKITTLSPDKGGIFGYVYYMPDKFKFLEGKLLSINNPDIKGYYYRKEYFNCFKENRPCFVTYHFKNPKTGKIEAKVSYFDFLNDSNFTLVKGIYASQIKSALNKQINERINNIKDIVYAYLALFFIVYLIFLILLYLMFNYAKKVLYQEYNRLEDELKKRLYYDKLTSLPNRNKLLEDIEGANALIMFDIKDFTDINDVYGFEIGDKILKLISEKLKEKYKKVYRIGSDEFAILFDKKIDEEILKEISNLKFFFNNILIEFVVGGSNCKERLLESSELALKEAYKTQEKYKLYDEVMLKKQKERVEKLGKLRKVLEKEDIIPYYHCIVDKNQNIVKYEALMRIKIDNEIKSPFFFMDLIKEARLYFPFSKVLIKKVLKDLEIIDKKVSINLSFEDIANEEMKYFILNSINEKNAKKIVFEILESESIKDYELIRKFIKDVKSKGAEIAIDDFGSGYSNFSQVLELEPSIIKIDASLIKNIITEPKNYKIVSLLIDFAKTFNLKTVAEFVENEEIFIKLKKLGIDEYQGYYFCKPEPLEKILKKDKISSKKGNNENRD